MTASQPQLWHPGARVGRSTLLASLASGGMAEIWLARQEGAAGFQKVVVIKRLVGALRDDPEHVKMFLAEAHLAAGLSHRNIVQIYELGEAMGSFFIVMEFIEGDSFSRVFKDTQRQGQSVPMHVAVQLVAWVAEALHYAHTAVDEEGLPRGVLHRDISPQNLLLTSDGGVKIVDFGIAKQLGEETSSGKLKGKLGYMPPEQARAEPLDARADVYALGVVLFELLTGTRLFKGAQEMEVLKLLISSAPLPTLRSRKPELPESLEQIVARAMAPDREQRYPSAQALQEALEDWVAAAGLRVNTASVASWFNGLFPRRAEERRALLDAARRGVDVSAEAGSLLANGEAPASQPVVAPEVLTATSVLPAGVVKPTPTPAKAGRGRWLALVATGLVVVAGVALWPKAPEAAPLPPAPLPATITVNSIVPCEVSLDGRLAGQAGVAVNVPAGTHEVECAAPGHHPCSRRVLTQAGQALDVGCELLPLVVDAGAAPDAGAAEAPRPTARASGRLNLKTTPWTQVFLGRRLLGETPLVEVMLPAGRHVLRLVNAEANLRSSIEVTIKPGQTTTQTLTLR